MVYLFIVVHIIVCFTIVGIILLQQGKSADLAGAFGGAGSQTAFGPRSAANMLTRVTIWCAVIFMITSIGLTIMLQKSTSHQHSVLEGTQTTQSTPAKK
jgi:preprotein translocase subunit SecG